MTFSKLSQYFQKLEATSSRNSMVEILPMVSEDTVLRDLKDLLNKKIIRKKGKTKAARYEMKP
jgi:predicted HTH transcriptional regulator